jgi:hypothetical protein
MTDERDPLDTLLHRIEAPPLPLGLRTRVLAHAPRPSHGFFAELWAALGGTKIAAPAFAFALALGIGLGGFGVADDTDTTAEFDELEWALVSDDYADFGS